MNKDWEDDMASIKANLRQMKWMLAVLMVLLFAILIKLFAH